MDDEKRAAADSLTLRLKSKPYTFGFFPRNAHKAAQPRFRDLVDKLCLS